MLIVLDEAHAYLKAGEESSQCGTMIALRMTNTRDKGHVSSAMQDELREMTEVLLSLRTGEAIANHLPKEATMPIPENMQPVASTNITAVGYDGGKFNRVHSIS